MRLIYTLVLGALAIGFTSSAKADYHRGGYPCGYPACGHGGYGYGGGSYGRGRCGYGGGYGYGGGGYGYGRGGHFDYRYCRTGYHVGGRRCGVPRYPHCHR
jgi:hypothetical protein